MVMSESLLDYRKANNLSQREMAAKVPVDRSLWNKWEKGMEPAQHHDAALAKINWRIALTLIEERTGGWIKNRFGDVDPTPTALQLQLAQEMKEASEVLGGIILAQNIDWSKRDEQLATVQKEIKDVVEIGMILDGAIQDMRNEAKKGGRK